MSDSPRKLLIAASGTGGHLFPAIALAEQLSDYKIEWLGVPNRLEKQLVPEQYPLHAIAVEGFQKRFGVGSLRTLSSLLLSIRTVQRLLKERKIEGVFTTGGYIAAPAIIAAKLQGLPVILHEANAIPGKVTRWLSSYCSVMALGFESTSQYFPKAKTVYVGTPVRSSFLSPQNLDLPISDAPLIVVTGGSQGAVAVNQLVRQAAPGWLKEGTWIVHLTGENDPDAKSFSHPQYISLPFYDNMAALLQRADLAIARAGAGTLTELAVTKTPSILIPYPYAAEDHQSYNAAVFVKAGGAIAFPQAELTATMLESKVMELLHSPQQLQQMAENAASLAVTDSAKRLETLVRQLLK